jgi:hypothetical protein
VDDQHAERALPRERPDGLAGAEAAKLKPGLEEKAVAGNRSGEQVDALVRGVLAFQEEKRVGVPSPGQAFEDSRPRKPGANFLPVEPAEEKVSGVFARELEKEFAFREGSGPLLRPKQGERQEPAEVEPGRTLPFHDA